MLYRNHGIVSMTDDTFCLRCYHTLTGLKFVVLATPNTENLERLLTDIYSLYTDYVMKDPFHQLQQPIKSKLFIQQLASLVSRINSL